MSCNCCDEILTDNARVGIPWTNMEINVVAIDPATGYLVEGWTVVGGSVALTSDKLATGLKVWDRTTRETLLTLVPGVGSYEGKSVRIDSSGNYYVIATQADIFKVYKFDSGGTQITSGWPITVGSSWLGVTSAGRVVVSHFLFNMRIYGGDGSTFATIPGDLLGCDNAGNSVRETGFSGSTYPTIARADGSGTDSWEVNQNAHWPGGFAVTCGVPTADGGAVVAGTDYALKLDASGAFEWLAELPSGSTIRSITADNSSNVYVGTNRDAPASSDPTDYGVVKLAAADGAIAWSARARVSNASLQSLIWDSSGGRVWANVATLDYLF